MRAVAAVLAAVAVVQPDGVAARAKFQDSWGKFCGVPDCYSELGLFPNATKAQIRRAYRSLSLEHHPDKNPGNDVALKKFNRVARANEVLTDDEQRKKLDYYTENPGEYWSLYGSYVETKYKPKTDIKVVLVLLLLFASLLQPALQYSKYMEYKKALVQAAKAKAPGGGADVLKLRADADAIVEAKKKATKKGAGPKMTAAEEKQTLHDTLHDLVAKSSLPPEYAFPTAKDNLILKVVSLPLSAYQASQRSAEIKAKIANGDALTDDEAQEVIEGYLGGADAWDDLSAPEQSSLLASKAYVKANFDAWEAKRGDEAAAAPKSPSKLRQRKIASK